MIFQWILYAQKIVFLKHKNTGNNIRQTQEKKMKSKNTIILILILIISSLAYSHCQIPCGIFDDEMRIKLMKEHVVTIEKSINELNKNPNDNQKVRWILNKENHANELSEIVTYYFMAQRIKESSHHYDEELNSLHKILVAAMKVKQSDDLSQIKILNLEIEKFEEIYLHH